ncbi:MAG: hypothetical protein U0586_16860 [Candidatus Brocadiaceae bacterium]
MLLSYAEVTNIIEKLEVYRIPVNSKNKRKHIDYVNTIKEKKKNKDYHSEPQTQQSYTKKDINFTINNPVTTPREFKGINIGQSLRNALMITDGKLIGWLRKKYKIGYRKAAEKLNSIRQANPALFYHGERGYC